MDILSHFDKDDTTFADKGIVVYKFKDDKKDDFLKEGTEFYRQAFISDDALNEASACLKVTRKEIISEQIPSDPSIQSGDFGEILTFLLFKALEPEYNIKPLRWRWQEDKNRAVHFADIMWLNCEDAEHPQPTDKLMTIEVKTRSTDPRCLSSINDAIIGAKKDRVTRDALTLAYMKRQLCRDKNYKDAKIVQRFENAVDTSYYGYYNAIAIVESKFFIDKHIGNIKQDLIDGVKNWNQVNSTSNKKMSVFAVPVSDLKQIYEEMYNNVLNS